LLLSNNTKYSVGIDLRRISALLGSLAALTFTN
jgi:hypothetical protein